MRSALAEVWQSRFLLQMLVARAIKVRYKNSLLGYVWSIVPLLLDTVIYSFVMTGLLSQQAPHYSAYLLCALIPWQFISSAVLDASSSVLEYHMVLRKVYMPREVIPLSNVLSNFIHYLVNWAIYFLCFAILPRPFHLGIPLLPSLLWFPVITLVTLLATTGMALWVSALNVFYEDVKFIVLTLFRVLFFVMPVIYPAEKFYDYALRHHAAWAYRIYMLNPVAAVIDAYKKTILEPQPKGSFNLPHGTLPMDWSLFAGASVIALLLAVSGYAYFNARKWRFVERT